MHSSAKNGGSFNLSLTIMVKAFAYEVENVRGWVMTH